MQSQNPFPKLKKILILEKKSKIKFDLIKLMTFFINPFSFCYFVIFSKPEKKLGKKKFPVVFSKQPYNIESEKFKCLKGGFLIPLPNPSLPFHSISVKSYRVFFYIKDQP